MKRVRGASWRGWGVLCLLGSACGVRVIGDLGDLGAGGKAAEDEPLAGSAGSAGQVAGSGPSLGNGGDAVASGGMPSEAGAGFALGGSDGEASRGNGALGGAGGVGDSGGEAGVGPGGPRPPALTALPIAHFKLDECDGPALDARSEVHGIRYGVECAPGVDGNSARFSAGALAEPRRIELADEPRFAFAHELTVAAWVKPEASDQMFWPIVGKWYSHDMFQLGIRQVRDAQNQPREVWSFSIAEPEGQWGRSADLISPGRVVLNLWTHVAGVYRWLPDGQTGHITLYVNGRPVAENTTKVGTEGLQQSLRPLLIGTVGGGGDFVGRIDEVRLYDVALGPELEWLYLDPTHP